nr:uncharacterized protein LOC128669401 isoform X2 [Plodia interpunctella]
MQGQSESGCSQHVTGKQSDLPIQDALHKSDEEFFAASVHFLRKRLHEKKCRVDLNAQATSQSCACLHGDLLRPDASKTVEGSLAVDIEPPIPIGKSLSMLQVLPFPKSSKYGFFARLKNTFKKYRSYYDMESKVDALDNKKATSDFKFPLTGRINKPLRQTSPLIGITEEVAKECVKITSEKSMCRTDMNIASSSLEDNSMRKGVSQLY